MKYARVLGALLVLTFAGCMVKDGGAGLSRGAPEAVLTHTCAKCGGGYEKSGLCPKCGAVLTQK